jgi:hypothetical protein
MIKLTFTEDTEHITKQKECIDYLLKSKVDVGLTSHASGRSFFLLGIHTGGSPIMHIPPRPVVDPALHQEGLQQEMGEFLLESCEAAFDGDMAGTVAGMEGCGQRGADGIREYIDGGISPPNSPKTLSGGWVYNPVAKKGVLIGGKSGSTPMKDTAALYGDFDYEITGR